MRDIADNIGVDSTLQPAVYAATTTGTAIDLSGFDSAALVINTGAIAGAGLYVVSLEESDNATDGDFSAVAAEDVVGTLPTSLAALTAYKLGYIGGKQFVRVVITKTSGTSIAAGALIVKGNPQNAPVA